MKDLIISEFYRCFRSCIFRLHAALYPLIAAIVLLWRAAFGGEVVLAIDIFYVIQTIFLTIHFTRENYGNTVRNKLIVGYTRFQVIAARLIVGCALTAVFYVLFVGGVFLTGAIVRTDVLAKFPPEIVISAAVSVLCSALLIAVVTVLICSLVTAKSVAEIMAVGVFFGSMFLSTHIDQALSRPRETILNKDEHYYVEMNEEQIEQVKQGKFEGEWFKDPENDGKLCYIVYCGLKEENMFYIHEPLRTVYKGVYNTLFFSQMLSFSECWLNYVTYPEIAEKNPNVLTTWSSRDFGFVRYYPLYSLAAIVLAGGLGIVIYRRKEFK